MKRSAKIIWTIIGVIVVGILIFLFLPSNYYIRRAITHLFPTIDQYTIFENRTVKAGNPHPWPMSADYATYTIDSAYLNGFAEFETVAFLVIRNDSLLFEKYWEDYGPDSYSNSFSMAKSVVSLMIGAALDDGLIKSVHQPVHDFLPQFGEFNGKVLTIEHLLTMSAGVEWDESYSGLFSLTTEAYYGNDMTGLIDRVTQITEPGKTFHYQSGVTQILAMILEKITGMSISEYASQKLWTPIEAEHDALWSLDKKNGHEKAFCCFNSNARDFARFGQLILNKGSWKGKQVVSSGYIQQATRPAEWLVGEDGQSPNRQYGYQFWILEKNGMTIPYLRGIYGQYVFAVLDKNAVIVRLGHKRSDHRTNSQNYPDDIDVWLDAGLKMLE